MKDDEVLDKVEHAASILLELAILLESLGTQTANNEAAGLRKTVARLRYLVYDGELKS